MWVANQDNQERKKSEDENAEEVGTERKKVLLENTFDMQNICTFLFVGAGGRKKRRHGSGEMHDSDSSGERPSKGKKARKEKRPQKKDEGLSAKQKSRIVSKATISTSEDESDNGTLQKVAKYILFMIKCL